MGDPLGLTASQTVGPYLHLVLPWDDGPDAVAETTSGAFWVRGRLLDGDGEPVVDGLVETWQADPDGRFDHPDDPRGAVAPALAGFRGFGRSGTDSAGEWAIRTVKPGPVPGADARPQAPHLAMSVFARGLLDRLVTRLYFGDETEANAADPLLLSLPANDRATLIAEATADGYRLDIVLQGRGEIVTLAL
jgi:protocatechuate 3,4-dioxygenase alpha subunit